MSHVKKMILCTAVFTLGLAASAFGIESVTVSGGDMERVVRLGMSEQELVASVGAPDVIKSDGRGYLYRTFDMSIILDETRKVRQIHLGKDFAGTVKRSDGTDAPLTDVFAEFGEPVETVRRTYMPSTSIGNKATVELDDAVQQAAGGDAPPLPMEYRGQKRLYELYGKGMVLKYKYVLDKEGIAFWMDAEKALYATIIYPPDAPPVQVMRFDMLYFDFDKDTIKEEYIPVLEEYVQCLKDNETIHITIEGHADAMGSDEYNQGLSERRAASVRNYFLGRGIAASRLNIAGCSERKPIAPNTTTEGKDNPEGRAKNRRVQFDMLRPAQ